MESVTLFRSEMPILSKNRNSCLIGWGIVNAFVFLLLDSLVVLEYVFLSLLQGRHYLLMEVLTNSAKDC